MRVEHWENFQYSIRDAGVLGHGRKSEGIFNFQYSIRDASKMSSRWMGRRSLYFQYSIRDASTSRGQAPAACIRTLFQYSIRDARDFEASWRSALRTFNTLLEMRSQILE